MANYERNIVFLCFKIYLMLSTTRSQECKEKLDIVFIVDSSVSIRENNPANGSYDNWQLIKDFVAKTSARIQVGRNDSQIGVLKYSTAVAENEVLYLANSHNQTAVQDHINTLTFDGGNTNTSGALRFMTNHMFSISKGDRSFVSDIAVLLTDGLSNLDQHMTTTEALNAKRNGIKIFTIGITKYTDGGELQEVASDPVNHHHLKLEDFSQLNGVIDLLLGKICTNKPPAGTPCTNPVIDLCIVMDESGSIFDKNPPGAPGNYNWDLMKQFVAKIISSIEVGPLKAQIAVMKFSSKSSIKFDLDDKRTTEDMVDTVLAFRHLSGGTNTSGALRRMREEVFQPQYGDRKQVPNVGIIVTDGESTLDRNFTTTEAMAVKQAGIRMFAVGITNKVDFNELNTIASLPSDDHVFYSATLDQVALVTGRLIWGICNNVPQCDDVLSNCTDEVIRCKGMGKLVWEIYPKYLLLGNNHARLQDVESVEKCRTYCMQDPKCRSIDYIQFAKECSISYVTKNDQPEDFVQDDIAEYHHWKCEMSSSTSPDPTDIPDPGTSLEDDSVISMDDEGKTKQNAAGRIYCDIVLLQTVLLCILLVSGV